MSSIDIANTKKAYAAFASGDLATVMDLMAPDCIWHVGGRSVVAGTYVGRDQILGYFGKLTELSGGSFKVELLDTTELPTTGLHISLVNTAITRARKTTEIRMVALGRNDRDHKLAELWWFSEDQYAQDASLGQAEIVLPEQKTAAGTPVG